MILLIDNYDSFSYNLYQLIGSVNPDIKVIRNDEMTTEQIRKLKPQYIILSPGPKTPDDAGVCVDVVRELGGEAKILGVCLGHQSICQAFGGTISYAKELMHGKQSMCNISSSSKIFKGLDERIPVARYHSLALKGDTLPDCLRIIASTDDGEVMAVEHRDSDKEIYGLQFHPESIMTPDGIKILKNFLEL